MSTPSPETDSLLGPTVHKKIEYQNLKEDVFFAGPFSRTFGHFWLTKHTIYTAIDYPGIFIVKPLVELLKHHT